MDNVVASEERGSGVGYLRREFIYSDDVAGWQTNCGFCCGSNQKDWATHIYWNIRA